MTPLPPQVRSMLEEGLWDTMSKYGEDVPLTEAVDRLQEDVSNAGLGPEASSPPSSLSLSPSPWLN